MTRDNQKKVNRLKLAVTGIVVLVLLAAWLGFGKGFIQLYRTEIERQAYIDRITALTEENRALLKEIEDLRTNMKYVETLIRNDLNMIKDNEVVYRFEKDDPAVQDSKSTAEKAKTD